VVIEIADDGGGLPREKILAKAISKGLVTQGQQLTDQEVNALIFEPGFSTAEKVTSLSGRGVGMDVVRRNITSLRGSIEFDSVEGQGTTMRIRLPLTLAIIDGFLVHVGRSALVIPLDMVEECVEWNPSEDDVQSGNNYMDLRGTALPFIRLREMFSIDDPPSPRESLVVVRCGDRRAGLMVDKLQGEMQTVIKPLAPMFSHLRGIAGSTILGNGNIALIIDVPALIEQMRHQANMLDGSRGRPALPAAARKATASAAGSAADASQPSVAF
jgi:two-component system chemotaxis sensor kinase CheA